VSTNRQARSTRARRRIAALIASMLALTGVVVGSNTPAAADRRPAGPPTPAEPDTGTATGSFRPGLTRAGLVSVSELGDAHLWVGLTSGRDDDARFDVQVELLQDGTPVASGMARCVEDLSTSSRRATELVVPWNEFMPPTVEVGDVLSLRVSARVGTNDDGTRCGSRGRHGGAPSSASGLRVHAGSARHPSGFAATITPDPSVDLYLQSDRVGCDSGHGRGRPSLTLSEEVPTADRTTCRESGRVRWSGGNAWAEAGTWDLPPQCDCANELIPDVRNSPPAPEPEPVEVEHLPLPPAPDAAGVCAAPTGCVTGGVGTPNYLYDGTHVMVNVTYGGSAAGSPYEGNQQILVRTDGTTFSNGDPWKCVTCGMPAANRQGANADTSYIWPFHDGKRAVVGTNVLECAHELADDACTPDQVHVYPIRWSTSVDGSGPGGNIRELRLHPDDVHLGFNSFTMSGGRLDQFVYLGRLEFNAAPATGTPAVPRYDVVNVTRLFEEDPAAQPLTVNPDDPSELVYNPAARSLGELRGFTSDGTEAIYIGYPEESSNIDVFAVDLASGAVRRVTAHPEYVDPMDSSPDDEWVVAEDTRGSDRQMFMAAMRGIPPLTDLLSTSVVSSVRNNGQRRFFQPWLIDRYGDRGSYNGQQLNAGDPSPGGIGDPNWNARADPTWSPDGTAVVYSQAMVVPPACGGANPLPCPTSTEPGGRTTRLMVAHLTSREPLPLPEGPVAEIPDEVSWGTPYVPGSPSPVRPYPPAGTYTMRGTLSGEAEVTITRDATGTTITEVAVSYTNYSDDGIYVLNGTERVVRRNLSLFLTGVEWYSDLVQIGCSTGTKTTSADGFKLTLDLNNPVFNPTGTLTTTVDGVTYNQPLNGT